MKQATKQVLNNIVGFSFPLSSVPLCFSLMPLSLRDGQWGLALAMV